MGNRTLLRVGSTAAFVGAVLAIVLNLLAPRPAASRVQDPAAFADVAGQAQGWEPLNVGIVIALLILLAPLYAVVKSIEDEPAATWARLGLGSALLGTALGIAFFGLEIGLKEAISFAGADAVTPVGPLLSGLFDMWTLTYFGLTALLLGLALSRSSGYPNWLGWVTVVAGIAGIANGIIEPLTGPTVFTTFVLFPITSGLLTVVVLYLGVLLRRKAVALPSV